MPKEETFLIPLQYFDVTRTTDTTLDVMSEKHIEDYWNVDGEKELSNAWTGFTRFILLNEKPPDGYTWSGERLTRKQNTSRPDDVWPDSGRVCPMQPKRKQNKDGPSRNQLDNDNGEEHTSSNQTMRSSSSQSQPLEESWKFRCLQKG